MSVTDPIGDMLTRIRNAASAGMETVQMPHSNMKGELAKILKSEGFITDFVAEQSGSFKQLKIYLKYGADHAPIIQGLRRISKPGLRRYVNQEDIPRVVGGMGVAILSTSKGVMTDKNARKSKIGGEVLCYVW